MHKYKQSELFPLLPSRENTLAQVQQSNKQSKLTMLIIRNIIEPRAPDGQLPNCGHSKYIYICPFRPLMRPRLSLDGIVPQFSVYAVYQQPSSVHSAYKASL